MKKLAVLVILISIMSSVAVKAHASDYQGEENRGSIFQVVGDLITGKYKVDGKPIKEKGVLQVVADETKKMKCFSASESPDNAKSAKP